MPLVAPVTIATLPSKSAMAKSYAIRSGPRAAGGVV
jgi:hypothetical protein